MTKLRALLVGLAFLPALADAAAPTVRWAKVTQAALAGTGTQDFTDATAMGGNTPEFAACFSAGTSTTDTGQAGYAFTLGAVAGGAEGSIALLGPDAQATQTTYAYGNKTTYGYHHVNSAGNVDGSANLSLITNGVRLTWDDQSVGETITCVFGDGEIQAAKSSLTSNNGTSAQAVTHGLSAAPDLIIAWGNGNATGDNNGSLNPGIGFWTSGAEVGFSQLSGSNAATTTVSARASSTEAMNRVGSGTTFAYTGNISNVGSSTFDITFSANHTHVVHFLAIRSTTDTPLYVKAGNFTTKTSTGTQADVAGMSGSPQVLFTIGTQLTAMDTGSTADLADAMSFGVALKNTGTGATQYGVAAVSDNDNTASSSAHTCNQWSDTVGLKILATNCTTDVAATVSSWDSGGVTHNYTANGSAVAAQVLYLAIGGAPAAAAPTYTSDPVVQSRTTSSLVFRATTDTTGTRYGARLTDGSSTPTCDQLEAQTATGGVQYGSQAATATVASDLTLSSITSGTVTDYYECIEDGSGNDSAVKAIANVYKTPGWTVTPSVTAQTDTALTITKTLDGAGTVFCSACPKDSTAPSAEQLGAAEFCGDGTTDVLAAASDDATGTMSLSSLVVPVVDAYCVGSYGGLYGAVTTLADECLDPATGKTIVNCPTGLTSIAAGSPIVTFNASVTPDVVAGDIPVCDANTIPGACAITHTATGLYSYDGSCSTSQYFDCNFYDLSAGANHADTMRNYVNNGDPVPTEGELNIELTKDVAMSAIDFCADYFTDPEGDARTCTTSDTGTGTGADKRPAGTTLTAGAWSGTPTSDYDSAGSFTVTATDVAGNTAQLPVFWSIPSPLTVPDCAGLTTAACEALAEGFTLSIYPQCYVSAPTPSDTVISQYPAASTSAQPGASLSLAVYLGVCPLFVGPTVSNLKFARGVAMPLIDYASRFLMGDGSFSSCSLMQISSATDITTANGAGTASQTLTLASAAGAYPGAWLRIGASTYRRVLAVDWSTNVVRLASVATWSNGATVSVMTVTAASVPGVSFGAGNCQLSGTPSVSASNSRLVIRATNSAGLTADSP